jgi:hypothetical protein
MPARRHGAPAKFDMSASLPQVVDAVEMDEGEL